MRHNCFDQRHNGRATALLIVKHVAKAIKGILMHVGHLARFVAVCELFVMAIYIVPVLGMY